MFVTKLYSEEAPAGSDIRLPCFQPAQHSLSLTIENNSNVNITKFGFAFRGKDDLFWRNPIEVASIKSKSKKHIDLSNLKILLFDFDMKFFINNKIKNIEEEVGSYPYFVRCVTLTVNKDLSYQVLVVHQPMDS